MFKKGERVRVSDPWAERWFFTKGMRTGEVEETYEDGCMVKWDNGKFSSVPFAQLFPEKKKGTES